MWSMHVSCKPTATPEIYTLSLHDALPISVPDRGLDREGGRGRAQGAQVHPRGAPLHLRRGSRVRRHERSEEHTSELQSLRHLVCRLLLEKKKTTTPRSSRSR